MLGVRAFTPVLPCCAREELFEGWGRTLPSNLSCLDQYLQAESDFNKRALSQLSYLHDRLSPAHINPALSLLALCDVEVF